MTIQITGIVSDQEPDLALAQEVHPILALEQRALWRWLRGDPDGFLEISSQDVVYFDPFTDARLDGKGALTEYYDALRGKISAHRYEIVAPRVQLAGSVAVPTYNFRSFGGNENALRWNCTEVFSKEHLHWRIIQTHWSFTKRV
jgi:SnoaL-like domain